MFRPVPAGPAFRTGHVLVLDIHRQLLARKNPSRAAPCRPAQQAPALGSLPQRGGRIVLQLLLYWVHIRHLVPLGEDMIDLHEGLALGLRDHQEGVDGGKKAYGGKNDEAVSPEAHLWEGEPGSLPCKGPHLIAAGFRESRALGLHLPE